ncbi:hypothetical protein WHR41_05655 [Cladosporium halotolerans]|uniref:RSE1/DDB1/CPSF1 first beta-propeller domain-containing protein n=1 Tax=Cladosporium halotolerans TaxID=1052096 RepID=A0AB34KNT6_9PEZI
MGSVQPPNAATQRPGVLTKTIIRTPVCKSILHARVRSWSFNDVVFVGEHFIHVKQVKQKGHLEHIATKDDFASRIRAARTFPLDLDPPEARNHFDFIKAEQSNGDSKSTQARYNAPPELVVLTLDTDDLVFLYLKDDGIGRPQFVHQTCPMPIFNQEIYQVGEHLAVDPSSRAVAVAANQREVVIYSAKDKEQIQSEIHANHPDWWPLSAQRPVPVEGVIQHLEFLHPPQNDPDHIILLVIVIENRRTKAVWIDWYGNTHLRAAVVHKAQPIESAKAVPSLLIPLREAAFLMITGNEMKLQKDIISGSMRSMPLTAQFEETDLPGLSPRKPTWTGWCRPRRNRSADQSRDTVYLIREDGFVGLVNTTTFDTLQTGSAGNVSCHVGTAFASLGDPSDPDILAVMGDASNGKVVHIGSWPSAGIREMDRIETMAMRDSEILPNWASSVDMVVSRLPQSHNRSPRTVDAVFVTSGCEPYGCITELRKGLEARLASYFPLDGLKSAVGAWVLPNVSTGSILMLLSSPYSTRLLDIDPDMQNMSELDESDTTVMALNERTLEAGVLENGHLLQVSETSIRTSASVTANFEDRSRWDAGNGRTIIAAALEPSLNTAAVVVRGGDGSSLLAFKHYAALHNDGDAEETEGLHQLGSPVALEKEALCLATTVHNSTIVGVVATVEGDLQLFTVDNDPSSTPKISDSLRIVKDSQGLCDHVVLLRPTRSSANKSSELMAICGLRDGRAVLITIDLEKSPNFGEAHILRFGHETVRVARQADDPSQAYAFTGLDACVLIWNGESASSVHVQNLWISDRNRPEMAQGPITAVSKMPSAENLSSSEEIGSLAGCVVLVSSAEVCFVSIDQATTTVPRQIHVSGTPNRLIYAERQRSLICASMCTSTRSFPSNMRNAQPAERRQVWPVIDFIPADKGEPSFTFDLQPGERIYALLEWSFEANQKRYSFIMVGGSFTRHNSQRGRIAFLQPSNKSWEIVDVKEGRVTTFDRPVYALALYDELTYIACTGSSIIASRFDTSERRWGEICAPLKLASEGTSISITNGLIYVSTAQDGLITLRLEPLSSPAHNNEDHTHRLAPIAQAPRLDRSQSHAIVSLPTSPIALQSTQTHTLQTLTSPTAQEQTHRTRLLAQTSLPTSLTRLAHASIRPLYRPPPPPGVLASDLLGLSTDGSLTGIALLSPALWRRLFWLQRVIEWSKAFSPHTADDPPYGVDEALFESRERALPAGFAGREEDEVLLFAAEGVGAESDLCVDGDVLARVLEVGGVERLRGAVRGLAARRDRVGTWVGKRLEEELGGVEGVVEFVRGLVGLWM